MSHDFAYDVFISYASPDFDQAEEVHRRLTGAGLRVWFDKARLNPGCDWHKEIEAGCEASRIVLPVLTPRWKLSEWTKFETYGAESTIPLIFEGSFAEIFTPPLTRFQGQAIDLAHGDEAAWGRLISAITELLARPAPDKLARLNEVRYAANPYFVGREADLNRIHEALHENPTAVLTQGRVRAITALGGIGKTTLARQYIEKFWRCYSQIFWVDCRLGIETEFARLCDLLLPQHRDETNLGQKARLALRELQTRNDRLLILDNAEDEASIQEWIPKTGHCRTLITSRFAGWSAAVQSFHLNVLAPEPARTLLATRAGRGDIAQLTPAEQDAGESLVKELGYLPLALEQAAAYIGQQGLEFSFADYHRLYKDATEELLAAGVLGSTEYPDSVMTTWTTTLRKLDPGPRAIIRLFAFLAPTPLPLSVLIGSSRVLLEESNAVSPTLVDAPTHVEAWVRKQVTQLQDYSMAEANGHSLTLHPLVQTVQRLNLAAFPDEYDTAIDRSLRCIDAAFNHDPQEVRNWPTLIPLVPHAVAVFTHAEQASIGSPTSHLMNQYASLLIFQAKYDEAESLLYRALNIDKSLYGTCHPAISAELSNLAHIFRATNRLAEAEPLMRQALAIDEEYFGVSDLEVAIDLNNLAEFLNMTSRHDESEALFRRALSIFEHHLGAAHEKVAATCINLAVLLMNTNRTAGAEELARRSVEICEKTFGDDHPRYSQAINTLAVLLSKNGHHRKAEPLLSRSLEIDEQSYGPEHPNVATTLNNLAQVLQAMDRQDEAESLILRSISIDKEAFGLNHPNVATRLNNLAQLYKITNRLSEAEKLLRTSIQIDEAAYGVIHPHVAAGLGNLGHLLMATGREEEAEPLMRRALSIDEKAYGVDHPSVARDLNNLGRLLQESNRELEAEPLMHRQLVIYAKFNRSAGREHPKWQAACRNYADLLNAMGRSAMEVDSILRKVAEE